MQGLQPLRKASHMILRVSGSPRRLPAVRGCCCMPPHPSPPPGLLLSNGLQPRRGVTPSEGRLSPRGSWAAMPSPGSLQFSDSSFSFDLRGPSPGHTRICREGHHREGHPSFLTSRWEFSLHQRGRHSKRSSLCNTVLLTLTSWSVPPAPRARPETFQLHQWHWLGSACKPGYVINMYPPSTTFCSRGWAKWL